MNRELKHLIVSTALNEAQKHYRDARLHALLNDRMTANMLPDGLSWYVEIVIDAPGRLCSHGYEVQLTHDGTLRAYGIGPGPLLAVHRKSVAAPHH